MGDKERRAVLAQDCGDCSGGAGQDEGDAMSKRPAQEPDSSERTPIENLRSWVEMAKVCLNAEIGRLEQDNIDHLEKLARQDEEGK